MVVNWLRISLCLRFGDARNRKSLDSHGDWGRQANAFIGKSQKLGTGVSVGIIDFADCEKSFIYCDFRLDTLS
jgi:hypothetical protein